MIDGASATAHLCHEASRYLEGAPLFPEGRGGDVGQTRQLLDECAEWLLTRDPGTDSFAHPVPPEETGLPVLRRYGELLRPRRGAVSGDDSPGLGDSVGLGEPRHPGRGFVLPGTAEALLVAARTLAPLAAWSPFYGEGEWSQSFLEGFAVGPVVGPKGSYHFPGLVVDLFLYSPGISYPLHAHPAEEIYLPLVGSGEFMVGGRGRPTHVMPGTAVVHRSDEPHGVVVGDEPLFGLAFLRGDLEGPTWYREPMDDESQPKQFPPVK